VGKKYLPQVKTSPKPFKKFTKNAVLILDKSSKDERIGKLKLPSKIRRCAKSKK